ncbi:MAG: HAD hydrolase-like protein [Marinosulfonomonas sp.]|nr:HAD hydrolase-like protein [Marinosulfonomonas sp.]
MKTVFLDLDGTLTDPKPGITKSFIYALEKLGLPTPAPDDLEWVIGPALLDSFARLQVDDPQIAVDLYRERYTRDGLFENRVYDGIPDLLSGLRDAGYTMCLATAKPHAYARKITAHFGLAEYLTHEFGPELDGTRNNKGDLLAYALDLTGYDAQNSIMIGDRHHDIDAARAVGMRSVGVTWGYGSLDELSAADAICQTPAALAATIADLLPR